MRSMGLGRPRSERARLRRVMRATASRAARSDRHAASSGTGKCSGQPGYQRAKVKTLHAPVAVTGGVLAHGAVAAEEAHEQAAAARLPSNCARANSFGRVYNVHRGERP
jgi:hypothetical protein